MFATVIAAAVTGNEASSASVGRDLMHCGGRAAEPPRSAPPQAGRDAKASRAATGPKAGARSAMPEASGAVRAKRTHRRSASDSEPERERGAKRARG